LAKARRESPQVKRLKTRVRNLKSKLAESAPKSELESLKTTLETKIGNLEAKVARSVLKEEADGLEARLKEIESKLAESIPRREAEAHLESTRSNLRREIEEVEKKLSVSKSEADSLRADLAQLQDRLARSIPKAESEAEVGELEIEFLSARQVHGGTRAICLFHRSASPNLTALSLVSIGQKCIPEEYT
jgi:chromosome segregation ATPase